MRTRVFLILLIGFSLNKHLAAQEASSVEGTVIDARTREPLVGATVALRRDGAILSGVITDVDGRFAIAGIDPGEALLEVRFVGYRTIEESVKISANRSLRRRIELEAVPFHLAALEIIGESAGVYRRLPGAASKLSAQAVDRIAPIGTQELLAYVPGIHGFDDDGIGNSRISIGIRGLNPRRSSRVLILEDGIPIQPALYLYPNMYYNPPVERIDRVEVIKGSGAIKYGPQTMGGVVNYITSRPRSSFGTNSQVTTGTNGYVSVFAEMGGWGGADLKPEVQLLFKRGDGYRENNDFRQLNGTVKLSYVPDEASVYYVKANVDVENTSATYTGLTEYTFENDPDFNPKENDSFDVFRTSLDLIRTRSHSSRLNATTRAYASYFDRRWWREFDVFERPGEFDLHDPSTIDPLPWYSSGNLVRIGGGERNFGNLRTFYTSGVEHTYDLDHVIAGAGGHLTAGGRLHWERFLDNKKIGESPADREGLYFRGDPDDPESLEILGQSHHYETMSLALYAVEEVTLGALSIVPGIRFEAFEQEAIDRLDGARYQDKSSFVVLPGLGANYGFGSFN
ncbi:MAG: TonB-dependent receptor, partial [Rhodothermales bacterium]